MVRLLLSQAEIPDAEAMLARARSGEFGAAPTLIRNLEARLAAARRGEFGNRRLQVTGGSSESAPLFAPPVASGVNPFNKALLTPGLATVAAATAGGLLLGGAAVATVAAVRSRKKSKRSASSRSRATSKRKGGTSRSRPSPASKRNAKRNRRGGAVKARHGGRKVLLTRKGQPYVLMANGKARFIKR